MAPEDTTRLERAISDFRVEMAKTLGGLIAQLDGMKDHDTRLRLLEQSYVSREELKSALHDAIESSRKIAWRDVGAIIVAAGVVTGIVMKLIGT